MVKIVAGMLLAGVLTACQTGPPGASASPSKVSTPSSSPTTPVAGGQLGGSGCKPPSPSTPWQGAGGPPEVRGTVTGGELWALLDGGALPEPRGLQVKIIWRMTGKGDLRLSALGPVGQTVHPDWGPEGHSGSNWNRPGEEWGAGFTFPVVGCWDIHAARDDIAGDVYVLVA